MNKLLKISVHQSVHYESTVEVDEETYEKLKNLRSGEILSTDDSPLSLLFEPRDIREAGDFNDLTILEVDREGHFVEGGLERFE